MTTPEPPAPQPTPTPAPLAAWGIRAVGLIIDELPLLVLSALTFWNDFLGFFGWLIAVAYTAFMGYLDGVTGQTPGKAVMGTRLVNFEGDVIGAGAGIGRKFVHIVDSLVCMLGWLLPLVDEKRQTIADKLMQTYVVTGAEKKAFSVDLWRPPQQAS